MVWRNSHFFSFLWSFDKINDFFLRMIDEIDQQPFVEIRDIFLCLNSRSEDRFFLRFRNQMWKFGTESPVVVSHKNKTDTSAGISVKNVKLFSMSNFLKIVSYKLCICSHFIKVLKQLRLLSCSYHHCVNLLIVHFFAITKIFSVVIENVFKYFYLNWIENYYQI